MWHIFFDLDLTLLCRRDVDEYPSSTQLENMNQSIIGNISSGMIGDIKPATPICNPIYTFVHQDFFSILEKRLGQTCQLYFLTSAGYQANAIKNLIVGFYGRTDAANTAILNAEFFNIDNLIPLTQIDYHSATNNDKVNALAEAKSRRMQLTILEKNAETRRVILIDDSPENRSAAVKAGLQVINPCADDYSKAINMLKKAVDWGCPFSFPPDVDDVARKRLYSI